MVLARRAYVDGDLPRLQAAVAGWRHDAGPCGLCHVGDLPHRIYAEPRGRLPAGDLVHVWEDGSEVAGIAINGRFGSAFDVFTAPRLRGTDDELRMLDSAFRTTAALLTGGDGFVVSDVYDRDHVRAALLERLGFARYRRWDHVTERAVDGPVPDPALPPGFAVRPATMADHEGLAATHSAAFDEPWSATEYRDAVMTRPGYRPEREIVAVAPDGRVAAFAVYWLDELNRVGHVEPVGTHRDFRRFGLARAVMLRALRELGHAGMATATVEFDASNAPAAALYGGLGFTTRFETYGFRRPV